MPTFVRCSILTALLAAPLAAAPLLSTDPAPTRALQNPIDMTVTLAAGENELKTLDWRHPRVVVDGTDFSERIQPLLEGAAAVPIQADQFVLMERTVAPDRIKMHIYGFSVPLGPHQVLVEVPRTGGGATLRYQAQYLVK